MSTKTNVMIIKPIVRIMIKRKNWHSGHPALDVGIRQSISIYFTGIYINFRSLVIFKGIVKRDDSRSSQPEGHLRAP